ncbi:MAG: hypothetical protein KDC87_17725 [Planctomycetes bacterium]|nr:hypothetical protein [Planctomycetota bacterium]MCB9869503.1 hypothetical protein [Planctomycetota bacterium]
MEPTRQSNPTRSDQARISPALFGFYASCAAVSAGAGAFFFATFVLSDPQFESVRLVLQVAGALGVLVGVPGAFICLGRARRPQTDS